LDPRFDLRKIYCLILALLNISLLICLAKGDNGTGYLSYYPTNHTLLRGEYVSGSFPSSIQNVDSDYLIFQSMTSDPSFPINPSWYTLGGSTSLISGNLTDLTSSNDDVAEAYNVNLSSMTVAYNAVQDGITFYNNGQAFHSMYGFLSNSMKSLEDVYFTGESIYTGNSF